MDKYTSEIYKSMNSNPDFEYSGVEAEIASHFHSFDEDNYFMNVESVGITFPKKNYSITRENSPMFILEYVVDGDGVLVVNDRTFHLKPRSVYILEPYTKQHYYSSKNNPLKKYWINFTSTVFQNFMTMINLNGIVYFENVDISNHFSRLFELENISFDNEVIKFDALKELLAIAVDLKKSLSTNENISIPFDISKAKEIIDEDFSFSISLDDILKVIYMSKNNFIKKFSKHYGITPYKYILKRKILASCSMLKDSNKSIKEIANTLHFTDSYAFSHAFKKEMGMSPLVYKKKD